MISLHKSDAAFTLGKYAGVANDDDSVFSFVRYTKGDAALVAVNLSASTQKATLNMRSGPVAMDPHTRLTDLFGDGDVERKDGRLSVQLPPYAVEVWKIIRPQP
jgi:hypothetical protein